MFERVKDIKLSTIKEIELRASKYPDAVSLAQGIPDFDTPDFIKRRVERALKRGVVAKYSLSPGLPELRELIEESLEKENMFYDWEKEILVTAGSIQGITATIMAITNPGDEVIIPEPTYTSYQEVIKLAGCKPVFVPLNEEEGWSFDIEKYKKVITKKTKAIFYCNPNNPTGTIYSKKQLLELAELAEKHNLFLISDEVYKDFIYDEKEFFSLAELPELRKRVIRIFSFSKAFAMTGWRVAYLHSDEENIREIIKVHDSLVTCAPVISQYGAMGALEIGEEKINEFRERYKKRRDMMCERIEKLNSVFSFVKPDSSYYIFPKINPEAVDIKKKKKVVDSREFAFWLLEKSQVAVVPGVAFGPNGEGHIRLSFGRREEDILEVFNRLEKLFL
ncbi:MAG: pyridoxal phosphate-dependent aminotransferase [Candidatus Pacebacteria bacterium]|nr:pyridoxal phosphate-dependent aminotransferase [Candidatus Paceibacterota bacterium]